MGSSSSKASRTAGAAARQYPKRVPPTSQPTTNATQPPPPPAPDQQPGPTVRPQPHAAGSRSEEINLDASDPDFARSLRSLGAVQPNPTMSPTSVFPHPSNPNNSIQAPNPRAPDPRKNPAIMVLDARSKLQELAEVEFLEAGRRGRGRQFLDIYTIRQILIMRDERGQNAAEIEKALGLKEGVVDRLGVPGVVQLAQEAIAAQKVTMV